MPTPTDKALYEQVKRKIYKDHPTHSAYRSGLVVQAYKRAGGKYAGEKPKTSGLTRWFDEEWRNQDGKVGHHSKSDIYRPTKRINNKTPATIGELGKDAIDKARQEKKTKGRVTKFASSR